MEEEGLVRQAHYGKTVATRRPLVQSRPSGREEKNTNSNGSMGKGPRLCARHSNGADYGVKCGGNAAADSFAGHAAQQTLRLQESRPHHWGR